MTRKGGVGGKKCGDEICRKTAITIHSCSFYGLSVKFWIIFFFFLISFAGKVSREPGGSGFFFLCVDIQRKCLRRTPDLHFTPTLVFFNGTFIDFFFFFEHRSICLIFHVFDIILVLSPTNRNSTSVPGY